MIENCKVDPEHLVDDYGCFDCFLKRSNEILFKYLERDWIWEEDIKEQITNQIIMYANNLTIAQVFAENQAQKLSRALAESYHE